MSANDLPTPQAAINEKTKRSVTRDVRINLVKAASFRLNIREATVFGIIQRLIELNAAPSVELDEVRWWFIDEFTLFECDASNHLADHPTSLQLIMHKLMQSKLIDLEELEQAGGVRAIIRLKTNVVIWE